MNHLPAETLAALDYFQEACPSDDARCRRLHEGAIANGGLLATDFFTLRDWLGVGSQREQLSLQALILLLMVALDEGSLCLEVSEHNFRRRLETLVDAADAAWWAETLMRDLAGNDYSTLIGDDADTGTPLVRQAIHGQVFLYFQKYLRHELHFRQALDERLQAGAAVPGSIDMIALARLTREVLVEQPLCMAGQPLELDVDQCAALGMILLRPLVVVSGGPGTGKTSLVLTALRCLARCGVPVERIALAAPTGRAAQRLGDSLRAGLASLAAKSTHDDALAAVQPTTLHQLLSYVPSTGLFRRHRENPIPADVVIVDEVSMVGLTMMAQLFDALAPETRLVLLGDKDQLPSVEAGAVLAHLLPEGFEARFSLELADKLRHLFPKLALDAERSDLALFDHQPLRDSVALLRINHRSERRIQDFAQAIRERGQDALDALPQAQASGASNGPGSGPPSGAWPTLSASGGCWLLPARTARSVELRHVLDGWFRHAYVEDAGARFLALVESCRLSHDNADDDAAQLRELFALLERTRLLTLVREGPWGCVDINRFFESLLRQKTGSRRKGLVPGTPILITRNDPVRRLANGDVGLALSGVQGGIRVVFPRRDGFLSFPAEALPMHELGFALTVHKSQGSEYDEVLLVFPPEGARRLLTRELVYTAVTRARKLAVLFGKEEVIRQAIGTRVDREAGWLRTLHGVG